MVKCEGFFIQGGEMSKNIADFIYSFRGNAPIIFSVRHDGYLKEINGRELEVQRESDARDNGTEFLGMVASQYLESRRNVTPFYYYLKVARCCLSREIKGIYFCSVLAAARECLDRWGKCYFFDLHRFFGHPPVGTYDVFLGTDNRRTIRHDNDIVFSEFLAREYQEAASAPLRIYVPNEIPNFGARFGATKPRILTRWLKTEEPRVNAIQLEFYKNFLECNETTVFLARALSAAAAKMIDK